MRIYEKPKILLSGLKPYEKITSLNEWLTANELTDAGITTYVINS